MKPVEAVLRPKGLGLGADKSATLQKQGSQNPKAEGKEELPLKRGAYCVVHSGRHKHLYGVVSHLMTQCKVEHRVFEELFKESVLCVSDISSYNSYNGVVLKLWK